MKSIFRLNEHGTSVRREALAGTTTFLTMAYIIFVQPAALSGRMFGMTTGMDEGAVMVATCLAAALGSLIMGIYANYPIALAPGMGENFVFVLSALPVAAALPAVRAGEVQAWQVGLGVVFISGILFLLLSVLGVRERIVNAVSPSMKNAMAVGIGLFIAFIGMQNAGLIQKHPGTAVSLNPVFYSPDLIVFFFGLLLTAVLHVRSVRGSILWGILGAAALAAGLRLVLPLLPEAVGAARTVTGSKLMTDFQLHAAVVAAPPSLEPTWLRMDLIRAVAVPMLPFILIFLFMDVFDTLGTLIGVCEQAGFIRDNKLPRAGRVLMADSVGTVAGACLGTSTVTSFIESAAGVEHGGRTGLTSVFTALLFVLALFFSPLVAMIGSYLPITAPALVIVGSMMMKTVKKIAWEDYSEAIPSFVVILGIPLCYSIADGLALGFILYPLVKLFGGRSREVSAIMYGLALILIGYFLFVRPTV